MKLSKLMNQEADDSNELQVPSSDGLTSGYQRSNITTSGTLVAETAGGNVIFTELIIPLYELFQGIDLNKPAVRNNPSCDELSEAYKAMSFENGSLAEEFFPIALEAWPNQES